MTESDSADGLCEYCGCCHHESVACNHYELKQGLIDCRYDCKKLTAERDEAREAARWLTAHFRWCGGEEFWSQATDKYPWLEEKPCP